MIDNAQDEELKNRLDFYSNIDKEYWSFRGKAVREHSHAYFHYPAMMVSKMQGELIQNVLEIDPQIKSIFDPFMGSGTILTEAMMQGLDFTGQDINPLAILICCAKTGPFHPLKLNNKVKALIEIIKQDNKNTVDIDFPNIDKWFREDVAKELSRIRRAIKNEELLWCRRFFWVALAETVRLTSNSRTSTFKLHIRPKDEVETRNIFPIAIFENVIIRNLTNLLKQWNLLKERGLLKRGYYQRFINIRHQDSSQPRLDNDLIERHDLLVTSPPYGDNETTVPYGQFSFLPLQWVDIKDIDKNISNKWLNTINAIDSHSLGGLQAKALVDTNNLKIISKSFQRIMKDLEGEPRDRSVRVAAFCRDLNSSLDPILASLRPKAYMIWTIGNRHVSNHQVPMEAILSELLEARGARLIAKLQRNIYLKRMATKNKTSSTIGAEIILIARKDSA